MVIGVAAGSRVANAREPVEPIEEPSSSACVRL
jgi:hypothetical protein